jgi:ribosome-associated toxin RatA of RatAB toxin-antitoxin module
MPLVERSILVQASAEDLFALSQDYARRRDWDPFTRELRFLAGAGAPGPGVRVAVVTSNGLAMEVDTISWDPPRLVAMRMVQGPRIFESLAGSWRFDALEDGRTRVSFRYHFRLAWWSLRPLAEPIAAWRMGRVIAGRLAGLARVAEAGSPATRRS